MKIYHTYFHEFEKTTEIQDPLLMLTSGGERGIKESSLKAKSDRVTRLIERTPGIYKKILVDENYFKTVNRVLENQFSQYKDKMENKDSQYHVFKVPKSTGGYRQIENPPEFIKTLQRQVLYTLRTSFKLLEHNNAHGYVKQKSPVTNAGFHIESNHFARIDFSNFFPSITMELIDQVLPQLGYFSMINDDEPELQRLFKNIKTIISYENRLPQGGITSPYISNLVMIPFDYHMVKYLQENHPYIIYTRYADDIAFSSYYAFADRKEDAKEKLELIVNKVQELAFGKEVLSINKKKTSITTKYGKNRITGIKVNKDHKLSIGYKEKRELKQHLAKLIIDKKNGNYISTERKVEILGYLAYLNSVEHDYAKYIETRLLEKFNIKNKSIREYLR